MTNRNGGSATLAPPLEVSWLSEDGAVVFDARGLTGAQRSGAACVLCTKRWPIPQVPVGEMPDGTTARACGDCARLLSSDLLDRDVAKVLERAAADVERYAPSMIAALISSAPQPYGDAPRKAVEAAAVLVAAHVQETEELVSATALPPQIVEWEHAWTWLEAWRQTEPPAAVLREVLQAVLAEPRAGGAGG